MKKMIRTLTICLAVSVLIRFAALLGDKQTLKEELIRLHVVANSDSEDDQTIKLRVRDAVTEYLQTAMTDIADPVEAKAYLQENLPKIQTLANQVLEKAGVEPDAAVSLAKEAFDTRFYDTFQLPAGVYESLRIVIGEGEGRNWWCVVFPSLCLPATSSGFETVAAGAGFDEALIGALEGKPEYEIRFFLLDKLGELENKLFRK